MDGFRIYLERYGIGSSQAELLATVLLLCLAVILVFFAEIVTRKILLKVVALVARKSETSFDDMLLDHRVFAWIAHMVPPVLLYNAAHPVFRYYPDAVQPVQLVLTIYLTIIVILVCLSFLDSLLEFYNEHPVSERLPLKSFIQVLKTVIVASGAVIVIARLLGTSPLVFFSGLGAFTAVIILIFKDAILGFVAGIQLTSNNLVKIGDWIEMPKYDADGEVSDISLVTVSVQNWDKTITVIPAYALISEGFRNWRGMSESGGRRIMRSVSIDMQSVTFCDEAQLQRLRSVSLLQQYLDVKSREIEDYNSRHAFVSDVPLNGRRMTNFGTFRAYLMAYLRSHPKINQDMTLLVRHLQPGENGIPLQIYVFCSDVLWANYEAVQADIMDHVLASLPFFGLRVFQSPSGMDIADAGRALGRRTAAEGSAPAPATGFASLDSE